MTVAIVVKRNTRPIVLAQGAALYSSLLAQTKALTEDAETAADSAALSAATAESAAGPTYPDTATGLAATSDGEAFAVDNGDDTVTVYLNDGGVAIAQRTLATTSAVEDWLSVKVEYPRSSREVTGGVVPTNYLAEYSQIERFNPTANTAIAEAYATMSGANSTYPGGHPFYNSRGRGTHRFGKKRYDTGASTVAIAAAYGLTWQGEGRYATGIECNRTTGAQFEFTTYLTVKISDIAFSNNSGTRGDSVCFLLHPDNGGRNFQLHNPAFDGFGTCVKVDGTLNGDTMLFVNPDCGFQTCDYFLEIADNQRQAIIHTIIQPVACLTKAFIKSGGSGEIYVTGMNGVLGVALVETTDAFGGNAAHFEFANSKLEYGYAGTEYDMLLINDRAGVTNNSRGASATFRNVKMEGGHYQPADRDAHVIMELGRKAWQIAAYDSYIPGTINLDATGSNSLFDTTVWRFKENPRAPKKINFSAGNTGPLVVYEGNSNIPDHIRWGHRGPRTIPAEMCYTYRSSTSTIINTGVAADQSTGGAFGARYGYERTISTGLPHKTRILRIGIDVDSYGGTGSDTKIELCQSAGTAATGSIAFSGQPAADSTVTINGVVWTFKASGATGNQVNIGANTTATVTALAAALNASAHTAVMAATYVGSTTTLNITFDLHGTEGNAFTIVAGAGSNGTPSGATLSGGNYTGSFTTVLETITIPSGQLGLHIVDLPKTPCYMLHQGNLHLRVSRNALNLTALGTLNVWYYPWVR